MIIVPCEQGSSEWFRARMGIPTASNFDKILTPKTLKVSESAVKYRNFLLAEWLMGEPLAMEQWGLIARGGDLEDKAYRYYEMTRDVEVERVGFILSDDRRVGCSPDGLVGDLGGLELKCPAPDTHVGYLLGELDVKYRHQIQGGLWLTDREWWDFMSYHPVLPSTIIRFPREQAYIDAMAAAVYNFCEQLEDAKARLEKLGYEPAMGKEATVPADNELPAWVWG